MQRSGPRRRGLAAMAEGSTATASWTSLGGSRRRRAGIVGRRDEGGVPGVVRRRAGRFDGGRWRREARRARAPAPGSGRALRARAAGARRCSPPRSRSGRSRARRRRAGRRRGRAPSRARAPRASACAPRPRPWQAAIDRDRAEQERRAARPGGDVPQPHRADERAVVLEHEGQAVGRLAALAQALAGLLEARRRRSRRRAAPRGPGRRSEVLRGS